jgi:hypothetical protein
MPETWPATGRMLVAADRLRANWISFLICLAAAGGDRADDQRIGLALRPAAHWLVARPRSFCTIIPAAARGRIDRAPAI